MIAPLERRNLTLHVGRYRITLIWNWPVVTLPCGSRWRWRETDPYCYTARVGPIKAHVRHAGCMAEGK